MNMEQAFDMFIDEARTLLAQMETYLLAESGEAESDPDEVLNAMFRAVHTIKGSAGLFDLDDIVSFAHRAESVMDRARQHEIEIDAPLNNLLLLCVDYLREMVTRAEAREALSETEYARKTELESALVAYLDEDPAAHKKKANVIDPVLMANQWYLSLKFGPDVMRNGMDPMSFLRYLNEIGKVSFVIVLTENLPDADKLDAETCYLGFEVGFVGDVSKQTLEDVFEFVREESTIRIMPPHALVDHYVNMVNDLPDHGRRLGELLVKAGCLTQSELDRILQIQAGAESSGQTIRLGEIAVAENMIQPAIVDAAVQKQKNVATAKSATGGRFVRVESAKIDLLIDLIGELVTADAAATVQASRTGNRELIETIAAVTQLVEGIRDSALAMRMVPVGEIFSRFPRVVRDTANELGKKIILKTSGAETELDKSMVEKLTDPMMHIVRNAMDHGIETLEERLAAGKSAEATLLLNAYHESGSVVIEVADDGRGLNRQRIRQKAIEKGLIDPAQQLGDSEIFQLIFAPGFSTAAQVTNLSGRGVGMDVVKRNVEELRGSINIHSVEGKGARFSIRLPLTLAIIDGFLVSVGKARFVVPLDMVVECMEWHQSTSSGKDEVFNLRGIALPCANLRKLFEIESTSISMRQNMVVLKYGDQKIGLIVDELHGELQAVIKPLGTLLGGLRGLAGTTILGSGDVALILDVAALAQMAAQIEEVETGGNNLSRGN